jgi:regulator of nucleoside diphosphate kinase
MSEEERHAFAKPRGLRLRTYKREREEPSRHVHERFATETADAARAHASLAGLRDVDGLSASRAQLPGLQVARSDYLELGDLTAKYRTPTASPALRFLERELSRAVVVDDGEIPSNVATLRSHLAFHDEETGRDWVVTLGHPEDFLGRADAISVLSPLGAALIGLSEGQSIEFQIADERSRRIALVRVLYQPARFGRGGAAGRAP